MKACFRLRIFNEDWVHTMSYNNDLFIPFGQKNKPPKGSFYKMGLLGRSSFMDNLVGIFYIFILFFFASPYIFKQATSIFEYIPGMVKILGSFCISLIGIIVFILEYQDRPFITIINGEGKLRWKLFFRSFIIYFILLCSMFFLFSNIFNIKVSLVWNYNKWISLIPVVIPLILIQVTVEEIIFRGFFQQLCGRENKCALKSALISVVFFTVVHIPNALVYRDLSMLLYYGYFSLFLALLVYISNGIEKGIGVHFANNLFGMVFISDNVIFSDTFITIWQSEKLNGYNSTCILIFISLLYLGLEYKKFKKKGSEFVH